MNAVAAKDLIAAGHLRVEDGNHGNDRPLPSEFEDVGTAFIRAADMTSGTVKFDTAGKITDVAVERIRKGVGRPGDVLLSHKGTVGKVAVAPANSPPFVCSPQTTFWRSLDSAVLDQRFLAFALRSAPVQEQLKILGGQTDMAPYVSLTSQRDLVLSLPAVPQQRAIAEVLGALDDKIATNAGVIEKSDHLAATVYRSVTTDSSPLSSLARFVNGKAFTRDATGSGRVVIRIAELNSGLGGSTVYNDIQVADDHVARPGDLLFAWSGSLTAARWFRPEAIINQHIFKVVADRGWPLWLVNQAVRAKLVEFKGIAADKATTMGHIQRHHLDQSVAVPSSEIIARIDGLMTSLWQTALAAEMEREQLAATRDELLPLLMSGRITVRDAESHA